VARTEPSGETSRNGIVTLILSKGPGNAAPAPGQPGNGNGNGNNRGPGNGRGPGTGPPAQDPRCQKFPWICVQPQ
jgi:hypothetical protein